MERNGHVERGEVTARYAPLRMGPTYSPVRSTQPCPCGSGLPNDDCHRVRETEYLAPAESGTGRPQIRANERPLASDPRASSTGVATRCHACGSVLTVGLGFGEEPVVLVCGCGAINDGIRAAR